MACEDEQTTVDEIQSAIQLLQQELSAATPAEKPHIKAMIQAAQERLRDAEYQLKQCQQREAGRSLFLAGDLVTLRRGDLFLVEERRAGGIWPVFGVEGPEAIWRVLPDGNSGRVYIHSAYERDSGLLFLHWDEDGSVWLSAEQGNNCLFEVYGIDGDTVAFRAAYKKEGNLWLRDRYVSPDEPGPSDEVELGDKVTWGFRVQKFRILDDGTLKARDNSVVDTAWRRLSQAEAGDGRRLWDGPKMIYASGDEVFEVDTRKSGAGAKILGALGAIGLLLVGVIAGVAALIDWFNKTSAHYSITLDRLKSGNQLNDGDIIRLVDIGPGVDNETCVLQLRLDGPVNWKKEVLIYKDGEQLKTDLVAEGDKAVTKPWPIVPAGGATMTLVKAKIGGKPVPVYDVADITGLQLGRHYELVWEKDGE